MTQINSRRFWLKREVRLCVWIILPLAVASCANTPRISIPVYQTPVAYAGLGVGVSQLDVGTTGQEIEQLGSTSMAAQATIGLEMADSWAIELRGADLGEAEFDNGLKLGYQVADLTALGKISLGTRAKVFGRLGLGALENDVEFDGEFDVKQRNQNHVVIGVGLDVSLSRRFGLRFEAMGHDVDASHAQLSLLYRFNPRASTSVITSNAAPSDAVVVSDPVVSDEKKDDVITNQTIAEAPAASNSTSKAVVNPTKPSITPIPTITPRPARIERQTTPQTTPQLSSNRKPIAPATVPSPSNDTNVAIVKADPVSTLTQDTDKDGVADSIDACASSPLNAIVNSQGCDFFGTAAPGVEFADEASTLDANSMKALNEVVASLQEFPDIKVAIGAYSPLTGDPAADLLLSRRRTIAVIRYLRGEGVDATRTQPIAKPLLAEEGGESLVNRIAIRQRQ